MNNLAKRRAQAEELAKYRLDNAVHAAIRRYFLAWVVPVATLVIGAFTFVGIDIKQGADRLFAQVAAQQQRTESAARSVEETLRKLQAMEREIADRLRVIETGVETRQLAIQRELDKDGERLGKQSLVQHSQLIQLQTDIARATARAEATDASLAQTRASLEKLVGNAEHKVERMNQYVQLQDKLLVGSIVETLTLRSFGTRSVRLPLPDRVAVLSFRVGNLKSDAEVFYSVDASPQQTAMFNDKTSEFAWTAIPQTGGLYEFRPEIVFYAQGSKVRDFITITVRRTQLSISAVAQK